MNPCAHHAEPIGHALNLLHLFVSDHAFLLLVLVQVGVPAACAILNRFVWRS